jgi:hypothetical protein
MTTPTYFPLETVIAGRLEAEAIRYANEVLTSRANGDKAAAKEAQRTANAFSKALLYWNEGIRPEMTEAGNWLLPSQRPGEPPHLLHKNGDWCCTCQSGAAIHWAAAMVIGVEMAYDDPIVELHQTLDATEAVLWPDGDAPLPFEPSQEEVHALRERFAGFNNSLALSDWC